MFAIQFCKTQKKKLTKKKKGGFLLHSV